MSAWIIFITIVGVLLLALGSLYAGIKLAERDLKRRQERYIKLVDKHKVRAIKSSIIAN